MTRTEQIINEHNNRIAVMQAYKDGEAIEFKRPENKVWEPCGSPMWWWHNHDYRVKPREPRKFTIGIKLDSAFVVRPDAEGRNNLLRNGYEIVEVVEVIKE